MDSRRLIWLLYWRWLQRAVINHCVSERLAFFRRRWAILAQHGAVVGLHAPDSVKLEILLACIQLPL